MNLNQSNKLYILVLIDSMEGKMDQINERLVKETKRISFIDRKSSTCGKLTWYINFLNLKIVLFF